MIGSLSKITFWKFEKAVAWQQNRSKHRYQFCVFFCVADKRFAKKKW
jgi:hypothetical protein